MGVINCPKCGKAVSEEFGKCPYCDEIFDQSTDDNTIINPDANMQNDNTFFTKLINKKLSYPVIIVLVIMTLFMGVGLASTLNSMDNLQDRIASLELDNSDFQEKNDDLRDKYDLLVIDLEKARGNITSLEKTNQDLTSELEKYKDQQATIDSLNEKIASLDGEIQSYKNYVQVLEAQLAQNAQQAANSSPSISVDNNTTTPIGAMVWLSATGEKYHNKPNCGNMNPDTARQISRSDAEARGYNACKNCYH